MYCYLHPDRTAVGTCTSCGRPICSECAVEMQNRLVCRECLSAGRAATQSRTQSGQDPNTAFMLELIGGIVGLMGIGYIYMGRTNEGILRLVLWMGYNIAAWIIISLLSTIVIGLVCCPFQILIQIGVPIYLATQFKNELMGSGGPSQPPLQPAS